MSTWDVIEEGGLHDPDGTFYGLATEG